MKRISVSLLEAALAEREEYLEELKRVEGGLQEQISNLLYEIDELHIRIFESYKNENKGKKRSIPINISFTMSPVLQDRAHI